MNRHIQPISAVKPAQLEQVIQIVGILQSVVGLFSQLLGVVTQVRTTLGIDLAAKLPMNSGS